MGKTSKTKPEAWEAEVEAGVRWANNILVEIQGNHGRHLDPARRDALRAACSALSDFRSPSARAAAAATKRAPGFYVRIVHVETGKVEREMGPHDERKAQKIERGVLINLGDDYTTEIVEEK